MENPLIDPHLICNHLVHDRGANELLWEEELVSSQEPTEYPFKKKNYYITQYITEMLDRSWT